MQTFPLSAAIIVSPALPRPPTVGNLTGTVFALLQLPPLRDDESLIREAAPPSSLFRPSVYPSLALTFFLRRPSLIVMGRL